MRKKSQLRIGESIAVILIFFILIFIGLSFYSRIAQNSADKFMRERFEMQTVDVAQRAVSMPELRCSFENIPTNNCFDKLKMNHVKKYLDSDDGEFDESLYLRYFNLFGKSKINITLIDLNNPPPTLNEEQLILYDYQIDTDVEGILQKFPIRIPVSVYDPLVDRYYFGLLTVESYRTYKK